MTRREDLLTVDEAAEYLGVNASWLRRAGERGPRRTRFGRAIRFTRAALDAYVEQCSERIEWDSTDPRAPNSGGHDSRSPVLKSAGAQVKSIADELRRSSGVCGPKLKPKHLLSVAHETKPSQT
jgi:excisionase family DNA binding protein